MVMGVYSSGLKRLYIQTWDGSNWTTNWDTDLDYDGSTRMFDIAYENNSGDVIVVFGDKNDNTPEIPQTGGRYLGRCRSAFYDAGQSDKLGARRIPAGQ